MNTFCDFLITEWLWSVTWGFYHILFLLLFMVMLLKRVGRMSWIPTLVNAVGSIIFAWFIYGFIIAWLVPDTQIDYTIAQERIQVPSSWWASMYLGFIYAVLQILFFMLLSLVYTSNRARLIVIVAVSNFLAAVIAYLLAPTL
ncbi:MAG: hypothetical protein ACHQVS_01225 [Candidatus Babeliales bacterium]